jgi:hypothetical protein
MPHDNESPYTILAYLSVPQARRFEASSLPAALLGLVSEKSELKVLMPNESRPQKPAAEEKS